MEISLDRQITNEEIKQFKEILAIKQTKKSTKTLSRLRCGIYARKSQEDTKDTSLQTQIDYCKELISSCDLLELKEIYSEDNKSGMTDDREEFQRLIGDVVDNKIDVVVCYRLDRFSRKLANTQTYEEIIRCNNAYLLTGDVLEIPDTAAKMFVHQIFQANAEFQARTSAERTKITMLNIVKTTGKYIAGIPPMRYERGKDGKLEINVDESLVIDRIFNSFLGGKSLSAIANELNEKRNNNKKWEKFFKASC
jgi:DNA invertase Pin-like site-specific DNA recombinase